MTTVTARVVACMRWCLGMVFVASSCTKIVDGAAIRHVLLRLHIPAEPGAQLLAAWELALGMWLCSAWRLRYAAVSAAASLAIYTAVLAWLAVADGIASRCPCGGTLDLAIGLALLRNSLLITAAFIVAMRHSTLRPAATRADS